MILMINQVIHLIFSRSPVMSWIIFVLDLCAIAFLAFRAYRDGTSPFSYTPILKTIIFQFNANLGTADGLDRFEVPFFGGLASSFVDSE